MPMTACQTPAQSFSATPLATSYPTTLFSLPPPASTRSLTYRPTLSIFSLYDKVLRRPVELATFQGITGSLANACFYACRPGIIGGGAIMNRGIKFAPFCVSATTLTASFPARANTVIFQCGTSFTVDLKNKSVNNQPATINATAIDWHLTPGPADDAGVVSYHIDRTTGILTEKFTYHFPNGSTQSNDPTTYRCTVGNARPTIPRFRR